jgi:23S rRNA (cytidine1920-2'-O)/16S rRNA (cytidine1409-2'-O)-methyltransferase
MSGQFVSRGGEKLEHALNTFEIDPTGYQCADLGASTGGFTDCLLKAGSVRVYAVDTGYGILAWTLRNDDRVVVMERSNALHTDPPPEVGNGVDQVVIDLGWTRQKHALPAARRWLREGGRVISLIKPHYEQEQSGRGRRGILPDDQAEQIVERVVGEIAESGWSVLGLVESPIRGGKKASKGNREWLVFLECK